MYVATLSHHTGRQLLNACRGYGKLHADELAGKRKHINVRQWCVNCGENHARKFGSYCQPCEEIKVRCLLCGNLVSKGHSLCRPCRKDIGYPIKMAGGGFTAAPGYFPYGILIRKCYRIAKPG